MASLYDDPTPTTSQTRKNDNPYFGLDLSSGDEEGSSDDYDTDDSETFGIGRSSRYPIRSVTLHTDRIYEDHEPGVINSSSIDQWITAILLQFTKRKVHNFTRFKYTSGPGKALEDVIKGIGMAVEWTRPWPRTTDDNKLKRLWLHFTQSADLVDDGQRLLLHGGERTNVFHHLKPISTFTEAISCSCRAKKIRVKAHNYVKVRNLRDLEKTFSNKLPATSIGGLRHCRKCHQKFVSQKLTIPDTTWVLVFEVDDPEALQYNDFQRKIKFGGHEWSLVYVTFMGLATHVHDPLYWSLQFVGSRTFHYNGNVHHGGIETFTDRRVVQHSHLERAVYFRDVNEE